VFFLSRHLSSPCVAMSTYLTEISLPAVYVTICMMRYLCYAVVCDVRRATRFDTRPLLLPVCLPHRDKSIPRRHQKKNLTQEEDEEHGIVLTKDIECSWMEGKATIVRICISLFYETKDGR